MATTAEEILEHRAFYQLENAVQDMGLEEYTFALKRDAIIFNDSHGYLVDSLTGSILAADCQQLDLLIEHMQDLRNGMSERNLRDSVKRK